MAFDSFKKKQASGNEMPFDATNTGIAFNTFKGLPRAALNFGHDFGQGVLRSFASTGLSLAKPFGAPETIKPEEIKSPLFKDFFKTFLGEEELKDLPTRVADAEIKIKESPLAKQLGMDKFALPLAFGGVVGSAALDLTPLGGSEKNLVKTLATETDPALISNLLKTIKVPDELIPRFAETFSKANTPELVEEGLNLLKSSLGLKTITEKGAVEAGGAVQSPMQKLLSALDEAGTARKGLEKEFTAERATRAAKIEQTFGKQAGQAGYREALGALKGELAPDKKMFSSLNLEQGDVDNLFNQIQSHDTLDVFDKITASNGLQKILAGEIPPNSQLSALEDIFGKDLIKGVMEKRPMLQKAGDVISEVLNIPRALITSFDMSAPLRQGVLLTVTKPKAALSATKEMFSQAFSPENFSNWLKELPKNPGYKLMKDSGLYIANPEKITGGLAAKEEKFMTDFAEKIPLLGQLVAGSQRAYVGYLNKLRVDSFSQIADNFIKAGITPAEDPATFRALADFVNNATGRGDLGKFERVAQQLNSVFFSPRLIASRFNLLNPIWYAKQPPAVRKEAIKSFAQFIGVGTTILGLAKAGGADVEIDPRSSDFGKIKIGNTRWDMWGGFQQWVRVFAQLTTGERKTANGDITKLSPKVFPFETRKDVAENFVAGKLAPVPGLAYELLQGQKLFGEDITLGSEALENTVPLYIQGMQEAIDEFGPEAIFTVGIPSFFGVGTQTYTKNKKKKGKSTGFSSFK